MLELENFKKSLIKELLTKVWAGSRKTMKESAKAPSLGSKREGGEKSGAVSRTRMQRAKWRGHPADLRSRVTASPRCHHRQGAGGHQCSHLALFL